MPNRGLLKLFNHRDQIDRKSIASTEVYADREKRDADHDPGILTLKRTAWFAVEVA
jgi:hypothetical protein